MVPSFIGPGDCSIPHLLRLSTLDCRIFLAFIDTFDWKLEKIFKAQNSRQREVLGLKAPWVKNLR